MSQNLKSFQIVTVIIWAAIQTASTAIAAGPNAKGCDAAQTFLVESVESGKSKFALYVCDSQLNSPRLISRGEIFKMYNATKTDSTAMATWRKVSDSGSDDSKVLAQLRTMPDTDLIAVDEDQATMTAIASWYQQSVARVPVSTPTIVRSDKVGKFLQSNDATQIAACLANHGNLVMSESKKADANGCKCGKASFNNYVDYTCASGKLVPTSGAQSGAPSGTRN